MKNKIYKIYKALRKDVFLFASVISGIVYFLSMIAYPLINGGPSNLMRTLKYWDTFNAAMIALAAALLAFFSSRHESAQKREIENIRCRVLLSIHLSEICDYVQRLLPYIVHCRKKLIFDMGQNASSNAIDASILQLPVLNYAVILFMSEATVQLDREVGMRIARTILDLQVLSARMKSLSDSIEGRDKIMSYTNSNFLHYMLDLFLVSKNALSLFSYCRGESETYSRIEFNEIFNGFQSSYLFSQEELKFLLENFDNDAYITGS